MLVNRSSDRSCTSGMNHNKNPSDSPRLPNIACTSAESWPKTPFICFFQSMVFVPFRRCFIEFPRVKCVVSAIKELGEKEVDTLPKPIKLGFGVRYVDPNAVSTQKKVKFCFPHNQLYHSSKYHRDSDTTKTQYMTCTVL